MNKTVEEVGGYVEDDMLDRDTTETVLRRSLKLKETQRKKARKSKIMQEFHMSKRSRTEFGTISIGDTVVVPVPNVDRGRCDA